LLQVGGSGEDREGYLFGEEIDLEYITFLHGVRKVTTVAAIVFERGTNVPANLAMLTKGGSCGSWSMSHNFGAGGGQRGAIVVEVAKHGGMGRKGGMNTGGA
jgi:hypothetical protein